MGKSTAAVDIGVHKIAYSTWTTYGNLSWASVRFLSTNNRFEEAAYLVRELDVDDLVVEIPRVYQGRKQKGDPNDLVNLALVAGACLSAVSYARAVYPHEWKGQLPKEVCHARLREVLSEEENRMLDLALEKTKKDSRLDLLDAVAFGAWRVGRTKK